MAKRIVLCLAAVLTSSTAAHAKPADQPALQAVNGRAEVRYSEQLPWRDASAGRRIRPSELVRCRAGCNLSWGPDLEVALAEGTTVRVLPPRFVRFGSGLARATPWLALVDGRLRVTQRGDVPVAVESTAGVVAVEAGSADVRAAGDGVVVAPLDADTRLSLRDGRQWQTLGGAALFEVRPGGEVALRARIAAPAWDVGVAMHRPIALAGDVPRAEVSLAWRDVAGASSYRVELARDEDFREQVATEDGSADVRHAQLELSEGRYFARVRSADGDGFWSGPSAPLQVRVVRVALPNGGVLLPNGALVLPKDTSLRLLDHDGLDVAVHDGGFIRARRELRVTARATQQLRLRITGEPDSESALLVHQRALIAETRFLPHNPTWPEDELTVKVRLRDPHGRVAPASVQPRFDVHLDGHALPAHFRKIGDSYVAQIPGRMLARPQLLRVDVRDGDQRALGRAYLEIVGRQPSK